MQQMQLQFLQLEVWEVHFHATIANHDLSDVHVLYIKTMCIMHESIRCYQEILLLLFFSFKHGFTKEKINMNLSKEFVPDFLRTQSNKSFQLVFCLKPNGPQVKKILLLQKNEQILIRWGSFGREKMKTNVFRHRNIAGRFEGFGSKQYRQNIVREIEKTISQDGSPTIQILLIFI